MVSIIVAAGAQATLGVLAGRVLTELNTFINNAGLQGNLVSIQAGRQISLALDQFKIIYSDLLQKTASQVDQTVIQQLQVIASAVTSMTAQIGVPIQQLGVVAGQFQMVVNTFAAAFFLNQLPQVMNKTFSYLPNGLVELRFDGNFPQAAINGMAPTLKVKNSGVYPHAANAITSVRFIVPLNSLFLNHPIQQVTLKVPVIRPGSMLNPWNWFFSAPSHNFKGYLYNAHVHPGQVTVGWATQLPQIVTQTIKGPEYIQSSGEHYGHVNHKGRGPNTAGHTIHHRDVGPTTKSNRSYSVNATPGWTIIGGRVERLHCRPRNTDITAPAIAPNSVSIVVSTKNTGHGNSGGVWFRIDRDEQQTQMQPGQQQQATHHLAWGASIFQHCTAPWTVTHNMQNGNQQTYTTPGLHGFLTILYTGAGVQITPAMQNIDF